MFLCVCETAEKKRTLIFIVNWSLGLVLKASPFCPYQRKVPKQKKTREMKKKKLWVI